MNQEDALKWIARVLEDESGCLLPEMSRDDIPTWDSVGLLNLMAELDEQFGIILSEGQLQSMSQVSDILEALRENGKLEHQGA